MILLTVRWYLKYSLSYRDVAEMMKERGLNIDVIGHEKPKKSLKRWREAHAAYGELGLLEERRGKGNTGRRPAGELTAEEKLKRAEARIKLLEAENDFLKKLEALERQKRKR
jgi:transposase